MKDPGEAASGRRRRGKNSQAKGPVMDGTLESCVDTAPKKQFLSRGMRNIEADLLGENLSGF